ncbi:hypothetical protein GCM10010967_04360 [Dyadobacter beijingensis]|uniref:DUF4249 domain-containing protein n=1 Tax=Dyadobacter beijingensis TaxID=365489 RepID=A0ABQ2HDT5_9BACT|nr:DUF4249 domain-containing protein [Dyadobacter beijingensis]GGM75915.1 hypothetical protein GCM10010967_04360 [Dyadobacter beijingensis]
MIVNKLNFIGKPDHTLRKSKGKWAAFGILLGIGLVVNSCIEPFSPPEVSNPDTYLVVDGFLNVNGDTSTILLSHTQATNDNKTVEKESGASITVDAENGESYAFRDMGNGSYKLPPAAFDQNKKYRLRIKRLSGSEYESDYVIVSKTPPIDSITYRVDEGRNAMMIYVNTHDATNATRFYKWNFEETYEYRMAYYSSLTRDIPNRTIVPRNENINVCWRTLQSKDIKLGSTIKLSQDIIRDLPINIVDIGTNKLYFGYTILLKQYGLSREAFEYWTDLAKTTQGTGSLFDPQPSQVTGNIHSKSDAKELVFGYFSAAQEQKKRIFIRERLGAYPRCSAPDTLTFKDALEGAAVLLYYYDGLPKSGYLGTSESCADCRSQGGTTKKPAFWDQ